MSILRKGVSLSLLALALMSTAMFAQSPTSASELERNKQLVIDFFNDKGDAAARGRRFMVEDYIQHSPRYLRMNEVTHASGREAWLKAREAAAGHAKLLGKGGIPLTNPVILMAEGDLVTAIYKATLPDPDDKSKTYEAFTFETFRVKGGKFVEHWDAVQLTKGWRTELEAPATK